MKFDLSKIEAKALHLMWVLAEEGFDARLCGGAVRDLLMDKAPKDWDIATTARPEQVMAAMAARDIPTIPTGLQHGTITAVVGGEPFEITTLRIDEETDGRHATVSFTDDWKADAQRRDFTMNAMYLDADGFIHDYFDGISDVQRGALRFVGDAGDRIREDYLRILRYFRFRARFVSAPDVDDNSILDVIKNHVHGLTQISGERIWSEIKQVVASPLSVSVVATLEWMKQCGALERIGLGEISPQAVGMTRSLQLPMSAEIVLARALAPSKIADFAKVLKDRYHASSDEMRSVEFYLKHQNVQPTRIETYRLLAKHSKADVLNWLAIAARGDSAPGLVPSTMTLYRQIMELEIPPFPVSGHDLMLIGIPAGPHIGKVLAKLKDIWADLEFSPGKEYLMGVVYPEDSLMEM